MRSSLINPIYSPSSIELDSFPFEFLSAIAERESWRKEVHRPIYHIHKWWANRLGSVFRGILLGCVLPENVDFKTQFYSSHDFSTITVFDPFMGSGTTVGESHKLGFTTLGRDINPVVCENVRIALGPLDRIQLINAFDILDSTVGTRIRELYKCQDETGRPCDVLYYFWVKYVPCQFCSNEVDLFSSYVLARNAYPDQKPEIQIFCPKCASIFQAVNNDTIVNCPSCSHQFDPHNAPARGPKATCPSCRKSFNIIDVVRNLDHPPAHRLYAKLVLTPDGNKRYLPATSKDIQDYDTCALRLQTEAQNGNIHLPYASLSDGYNTRQAISYGYRKWSDFFNHRQLLALGWLHEAISNLPDPVVRDPLLTLFSGILEFNNIFASYKGEGTGAIRHMFAHHILKPERTPIEANVWGTRKSSGSFSTLFKSRMLRAVDYRNSPHELSINGSSRVYNASKPFSGKVEENWPTDGFYDNHAIYLSCGSSHFTELPDNSIDLIITDPPFFDNVHYSELADFFSAWQSLHPHGFIQSVPTTRNQREVQDTDPQRFSDKLRDVLHECYRIMKDRGILAFTYHHSRSDGWLSLLDAVSGAGFSVINAHPVKSEMSVAIPKSQTKEPIQLDVVFVCRKRTQDIREKLDPPRAFDEALQRAQTKLNRLVSVGLWLSPQDRRVILISQFISTLGPFPSTAALATILSDARLNNWCDSHQLSERELSRLSV